MVAKLNERTPRHLTVGDRMTACPWTLGPSDTMAAAFELMQERDIRHVPIVDSGELVGIVSKRALQLSRSPDLNVSLDRVMIRYPYAVSPDSSLAETVNEMAERRCSIVPVVRGGRVVGVFSTIDALRELARQLRLAV